ncbi:MAG: hypothetical protein ACRD27_00485 [Terracidiphilus sp.]
MGTAVNQDKRNVTLRLSGQTLHRARILAARRSTSISGLLSHELERLVAEDDAYARAQARAFAMMEEGFDLGGSHHLDRDALHER